MAISEPLVSNILRNFSSLRVSAWTKSLMRLRCFVSETLTRCDPRIEATIADKPEMTKWLRQSNWLENSKPDRKHKELIPACQPGSHGRMVPPTGRSTRRNMNGANEAPLMDKIPALRINPEEKSSTIGFQT